MTGLIGRFSDFVRALAARFVRADREFGEALFATAAAFIFKIGGALFGFLLSWIVARHFGAEGSGVFALASTFLTIATTVSLFGLDYSSIQAVSAHRATKQWAQLRSWVKTASLVTCLSSGAVSVVLLVGSERIAMLVKGSPSLSFGIAVLGLAVVPVTLTKIFSSYLRGMQQVLQANSIEMFLVPFGTVLLILCYGPDSVRGVMVLYLIAASACALVGAAFWTHTAGKVEKARPNLMVRAALSKSLPIYMTVLTGFAATWVTTLTLGVIGTEADVGVYRVAQQIVLVLYLIPQAVDIGMSPQFAALYAAHKLDDIARIGRRITVVSLLLGGIPACMLFLFAEYALAVFGPDFVAGTWTLRIIILTNIVTLLFGPVGSAMLMTGLERLSLVNGIIGSIVVFVSCMILVPRYELHGAAMAALIAVTFRLSFATVALWRYRGLLLPLGLARCPAA